MKIYGRINFIFLYVSPSFALIRIIIFLYFHPPEKDDISPSRFILIFLYPMYLLL